MAMRAHSLTGFSFTSPPSYSLQGSSNRVVFLRTTPLKTSFFNGGDAYRAAVKGDWNIVYEFYTRKPLSPVNASGDTILHVLALNRHTDIIHRLLELPLPAHDSLSAQNCKGNTALHEAIRVGSMEIVHVMVPMEESLIFTRNLLGETPLFWAAAYGKREILDFLLESNRNENLHRRNDLSTILHAAVKGEHYGLALKIIEECPSLALARTLSGITPLHLLAQSPASFRSGTMYKYQNIGSSAFIPMEMLAIIVYICLPVSRHGRNAKVMELENRSISGIQRFIRCCRCLRSVDDVKDKHNYALKLGNKLITIHGSSNMSSEETDNIKEPLLLAIKHGIVELVEKILEEIPEAIEWVDEHDKNILHLATEYRSEQVFEFLKSKNFPISRMVAEVDKDGNTPLHLAAKLGGRKPMYLHGPLNQMVWEVFWFKHIELVSLPHLLLLQNFSDDTAKEIFDKTHQDLQLNAEEWVKDTSNTSMVVTVLIATINFQAAFTMPGGYDQNKGFPIFLYRKYFTPCLFLLSISVFLSFTSLGISVSSLFTRSNQQDYFLSFPIKRFVGGTTFFLSLLCTIWAYCQAIYLETTPISTTWSFLAAYSGIVGAHILAFLVYIDNMFPIIRSIRRALADLLTYHREGL